MVKQDNLTPRMISEHFYLNIKWEKNERKYREENMHTHKFLIGIKKKEKKEVIKRSLIQ